jgi:tetratricopeptide (TPR) repeat protein
MQDDGTPTQPQVTDAVTAQVQAFRQEPTDGDLYAEVREALRNAKQAQLFAEIAELRAQHVAEARSAAKILTEAAEARLAGKDEDTALRDLRRAVELDPGAERSVKLLVRLLLDRHSYAEVGEILEAELAALGDDAPAPARAERHARLAELWDDYLGRVDRALHHWKRAWQLAPQDANAVNRARALYASVGDYQRVADLYRAQIECLPESDPARAELELELGRTLARHGELAAAAQHLEVALALLPDSARAREALAEAYSSPTFVGQQEAQRRAGALFVELGDGELRQGQLDRAIEYLRRALGVDPYTRVGTARLEEALVLAQRWTELDRLYEHRSNLIEDASERLTLLCKRAALYQEHIDDRAAHKRCLAEIAALEPTGGNAARQLRALYREDQEWRALAELMAAELQALSEDDVAGLTRGLLDLATITKEHLGDRDRAAEYLHRILSVNPSDQNALDRYAEHFRERKDWRGLADLTEFAIEQAREAGVSAPEILRQLEELAQLAEVRLGDVDRASATWQRILEMDPGNAKAHEAQRRLESRTKMWQSLVGVLEQEAAAAQGPQQRAEALRRIAQVLRERHVSPRRAIALYEEILTILPEDEPALKALNELYEREGDDAGLARALRRQLDIAARRVLAELHAAGKGQVAARDWPVAQRVERLTTLRRLASMYEQRLADVEGVVFACSGVLEILPGDRDALQRMERVLEKAGDVPRLEQTLHYHAESANGPAERAKVLRQLARLAEGRSDHRAALECWEKVLKIAPNDPEALTELAVLYEQHQRWPDLAAVLERAVVSAAKPAQAGSPEAAARAAQLHRLALVADEHLHDDARAAAAYRQLLELQPRHRQALAALAKIYEQGGQWRQLTDVLALQAPLFLPDEPERAAEVSMARAQLLEGRLGAPGEAAGALEQLLATVAPADLAAHQMLRRLYEASGAFEQAVRVAERQMYLTADPVEQVALGLEIGQLCRDSLSDSRRALQAFERVLEIDPDNRAALAAAAELYAAVGNWRGHVDALQRQLEHTPAGPDRRTLLLRIARATAEKLGDQRTAFELYRRAHEHAPDATTMAELRRVAEAYDLWAQLADVYETERARVAHGGSQPDPAAYQAICRQLATIVERRMSDRLRAMNAWLDALRAAPTDDGIVAELERIAAKAAQPEAWTLLVDALLIPLAAADRSGRVALHSRRARLYVEHLGDPAAAVKELLQAFAWGPEHDDTRAAIYTLAERTGAWPEVLAVESALFERAPAAADRLAILRRKAQVMEDRLGQPVRAFRTYLSAFLMAPDDADTVSQLWRLAKQIGTYAEADRTPQPEPPAAHVELTPLPQRRPARPSAASEVLPRPPAPARRVVPAADRTQELSISDLMFDKGEATRGDATIELDIRDLEPPGRAPRGDPTIELRTEDLIQALRSDEQAGPQRPPEPRPLPGVRRPGVPPPPPARRPEIQRQTRAAARAGRRPPPTTPPPATPPRPGRTTRPSRPPDRSRPPTVPVRAYESAWEEFATAFDVFPAATAEARLRWVYRAAEVWENGAQDVQRAFAVLQAAIDLAPDDPEPRARLHRLASEHGQWDRLAEMYEAAAENAATARTAAALFMEVAAIREAQGQPQHAERLYRRILGMRPDDRAARTALETMFRDRERWVDLAASLEERTDPRLGAAAPEAERPALLRELAALYRDQLARPRDALDALERLRTFAPEDADILTQMAAINESIGHWSQAVDALHKLADVAAGTPQARSALRRIALIYRDQIELPDRAIEAFRELVAGWPDDVEAYGALDTLYSEHARWAELAEVLARRVALEQDPGQQVELLRRRATVLLQWLQDPDEAAAVIRHARTLRPDDPGLAEDLLTALARCGRATEAGAVLEGRIEALRQRDAPAGEQAALLTRLAQLRATELNAPAAARAALDRALELVPEHPSALALRAKLTGSDDDPRTRAEAQLRRADALTDLDGKIAALLEAGRLFQQQCNDSDAARDAFAQVLRLRPTDADATWALAGLIEQGGDLDAAAMLLEKRLQRDDLPADERARILTQVAALARHAGVDAAAERHLRDALAVAPEHLAAVIALADLYTTAARYDELEAFLRETIPALESAPLEAQADLASRLALAYEALGREDQAYQTLLEADRLHRGDLLVKLALGNNRYRARRWREAALHLGALAHHPDAERHAKAVAEGLYRAALAEIRALRPDKSEALYARAIELDPHCSLALHALAELEMERGNTEQAADLLIRQAQATNVPGERLRLYEALGDLALMALHDEQRALACYQQAVNAADPLESQHLGLLEKLLERQDLANDVLGAGRTAELMASFAETAAARAARYTTAAENYLSGQDLERARAAAQRAVDAAPYDLTVLTVASDVFMKAGEFERVAEILGRALTRKPIDDEVSAVRSAELWRRLGQARDLRGDKKGAVAALQTAIEVASESDGAMRARRELLELWKDDDGKRDEYLAYARAVAYHDRRPDEILLLARAHRREPGAGPVHADGGRVGLELAQVMGESLSAADQEFLAAHPPRHMAADEAYRGVLSDDQRRRLVLRQGVDDGREPLAEVFAALWEAAPLLWSDVDLALERVSASACERASSKTDSTAAVMLPSIARALDTPRIVLYTSRAADAADIKVVCVAPPVLVLGPKLWRAEGQPAAVGEPLTDLELRFLLGRAAELTRPANLIATGLPPDQVAALVASLRRVFQAGAARPDASEATREHDAMLKKTLPVKLRTRLEEILNSASPAALNPERYTAMCLRAADRAGLLVCGDVATAIRMAGGPDRAGHLIELVLDEEYLDVRAKLGIGIAQP